MRFLNKVLTLATFLLIYCITGVSDFWGKLNKKALAYTVLFWTIFYILVKYFEYNVPLLVVVGVPLFALILTYKLFSFITKEKKSDYGDSNLFSLILTTLFRK